MTRFSVSRSSSSIRSFRFRSATFFIKKGIVTQEGTKKVITFNVRVVFTVLAVISFWSLHIGPAIFWVPVIALVITFLPYFIMMAATKKNPDPRERGALVTAGHAREHRDARGSCLLCCFSAPPRSHTCRSSP